MRQHHSFGVRGGTRRILQTGHRVSRQIRWSPLLGHRQVDVVTVEPTRVAQQGVARAPGLQLRQQRGAGQYGLGRRISSDRSQLSRLAAGMGQVSRHCHHAGIQTPQKGGNELQAGRIQQQSRLPRLAEALEICRDGPGFQIQLRISPSDFSLFAIDQEAQCPLIRLPTRTLAQ